jgi:hypothetical protein
VLSLPLLSGLDGELCCGSLTSKSLCRDTTSYVNSYSYHTAELLPNWYIFDFITPETAGLPYAKRWELAQAYVQHLREKYPELYFLHSMPGSRVCNSIDEVLAAHSEFIAAGFEGTIIRYALAPHKNGRSTVIEGAYMRIKDFASEEVRIVGMVEAQTNCNAAERNELGLIERSSSKENKCGKDMVGSLQVRRASGEVITIGPGSLTHAQRIEYWENPSLILGKPCTFTYMPYGMKDKPRFPLFSNFRAEEDL